MVVVAVVAVLIALILPALTLARASALRSVCLSNLRSLGTTVTAYVAAYEVVPFAGPRYTLPEGRTAILDLLTPYLDAAPPRLEASGGVVVGQPFRCPADPDRAAADGFSYEYIAGAFLADYGLAQDPNPQLLREVTAMYEADLALPLMEDGADWHRRGFRSARNALYFDGRADWKR